MIPCFSEDSDCDKDEGSLVIMWMRVVTIIRKVKINDLLLHFCPQHNYHKSILVQYFFISIWKGSKNILKKSRASYFFSGNTLPESGTKWLTMQVTLLSWCLACFASTEKEFVFTIDKDVIAFAFVVKHHYWGALKIRSFNLNARKLKITRLLHSLKFKKIKQNLVKNSWNIVKSNNSIKISHHTG